MAITEHNKLLSDGKQFSVLNGKYFINHITA